MRKLFKKSIAFVLTLAIALTSLVVMNTTEVKAANNYKDFIMPANDQCHLDKVFYDENSISCAVMH